MSMTLMPTTKKLYRLKRGITVLAPQFAKILGINSNNSF